MDTIWLQVILTFILLISALLGSILPLKIYTALRKRLVDQKNPDDDSPSILSHWISSLSCFAGGVFLSVIFLHLLPDAHESLRIVQSKHVWKTEYPLVEIMTLFGFFFVYMIEVVSETCFTQSGAKHRHKLASKLSDILRINQTYSASSSKSDMHSVRHEISSICSEQGRKHCKCFPKIPRKERTVIIRSITFIVALVFHSVVEGFAFGVQKNARAITTLFVGIIVHRTIVSFSVGTRLVTCHPNRPIFVIILAFIFSVSSPLFAVVGMFVRQSAIDELFKEQITFILISLSIGTFLYIAFFEMLAPAKLNETHGSPKFLATFCGFLIIAVIIYFE